MAIDKAVDSTQLNADLTSIANAIRTKGETSAPLAFPNGFISAIQDIQTGGVTVVETQDAKGGKIIEISGDATKVEPITITENGITTAPTGTAYSPITVNVQGGYSADEIAQGKAPSGSVILSVPFVSGYNKDGICEYAFYGNSKITSIELTTAPNVYGYAFANMKSLKSFSAPNATSLGNIGVSASVGVLKSCQALETVHLPKVTIAGTYMFQYCTALVNIALPRLAYATANGVFNGCTSLASADFGAPAKIGGSDFFKNCSSLTTLILRGSSVCTLNNIGCLSGTPFASGGTGGTLYVLQALITDYQAASNWSTILGYENNQIKSIESTHTDPDAPIDLTLYYADGTPIS